MGKTIVLNHKSFLTLPEIKEYLLNINDMIRKDQNVIICPTSIYFPYFTGKYNFKLGAQSLYPKSINGEITGKVLRSFQTKYVLIGHNERKNEFNETPKQINSQIKEAIKNGITPIIIVGETYYQKQMKKTGEVITKQLREYLNEVEVKDDIIIGYEPNWNNNIMPTNKHIEEVTDLIKTQILRKYNANVKVLFGTNISSANISTLEQISNIDGYIIGKSSTDINEINKIFNIIE